MLCRRLWQTHTVCNAALTAPRASWSRLAATRTTRLGGDEKVDRATRCGARFGDSPGVVRALELFLKVATPTAASIVDDFLSARQGGLSCVGFRKTLKIRGDANRDFEGTTLTLFDCTRRRACAAVWRSPVREIGKIRSTLSTISSSQVARASPPRRPSLRHRPFASRKRAPLHPFRFGRRVIFLSYLARCHLGCTCAQTYHLLGSFVFGRILSATPHILLYTRR